MKKAFAFGFALALCGGVAMAWDHNLLLVKKLFAERLLVGSADREVDVGDAYVADDLSVADDVAVTGDLAVTGTTTLTGAVSPAVFLGPVPAAQTIAAAGTIAADACGGIKIINSAAAVTTNTTNTFTAPAASNKGCIMALRNENAADAITLDANALFQAQDGANVALAAGGTVIVGSTGALWIQLSAAIEPNA